MEEKAGKGTAGVGSGTCFSMILASTYLPTYLAHLLENVPAFVRRAAFRVFSHSGDMALSPHGGQGLFCCPEVCRHDV